jgi:hypothetical protein
MRYVFSVTVEVERSEGKFATRDEIGEQIAEAITEADPGNLTGENGGEYNVTVWEVTGPEP